jgi:DNA-binding HxlR family transcriptional regulator
MMQPMRRTSFSGKSCSVAQCLEIVGEWWSFLIIRDAFLGVRRFDDFQVRLAQHPNDETEATDRARDLDASRL